MKSRQPTNDVQFAMARLENSNASQHLDANKKKQIGDRKNEKNAN